MNDIAALFQIIRDSHMPKPEHCHLLDDITLDDYEYHSVNYAHIYYDEKILFAVGGANDKFNGLADLKPWCITDKYLHVCGWSIFDDDCHIPLSEIQSIEIGDAVYKKIHLNGGGRTKVYDGQQLLVNGKQVAKVRVFYGTDPDSDPNTLRMLCYVFAIMSGLYTEEQLRKELEIWANAPDEQLKRPVSLSRYIWLTIFTAGMYPFIYMRILQKRLNVITANHDYKPLDNYWWAFLLSIPTVGVVGFIWRKRFLDRMEQELRRRNLYEKDSISATGLWLIGFFSIVILIGAIVFFLLSDNFMRESIRWYIFPNVLLPVIGVLAYRYFVLKYMRILIDDYNMNG